MALSMHITHRHIRSAEAENTDGKQLTSSNDLSSGPTRSHNLHRLNEAGMTHGVGPVLNGREPLSPPDQLTTFSPGSCPAATLSDEANRASSCRLAAATSPEPLSPPPRAACRRCLSASCGSGRPPMCAAWTQRQTRRIWSDLGAGVAGQRPRRYHRNTARNRTKSAWHLRANWLHASTHLLALCLDHVVSRLVRAERYCSNQSDGSHRPVVASRDKKRRVGSGCKNWDPTGHDSCLGRRRLRPCGAGAGRFARLGPRVRATAARKA